jgi:hypothetical protein
MAGWPEGSPSKTQPEGASPHFPSTQARLANGLFLMPPPLRRSRNGKSCIFRWQAWRFGAQRLGGCTSVATLAPGIASFCPGLGEAQIRLRGAGTLPASSPPPVVLPAFQLPNFKPPGRHSATTHAAHAEHVGRSATVCAFHSFALRVSSYDVYFSRMQNVTAPGAVLRARNFIPSAHEAPSRPLPGV